MTNHGAIVKTERISAVWTTVSSFAQADRHVAGSANQIQYSAGAIGSFSVGSGGQLTVSGGTVSSSGTAAVGGGGMYVQTGGTVSTGDDVTVHGDMTISGGEFRPSCDPGRQRKD